MKKKSFIEKFGAGIACICFALTCVFGGIAAGFMPKKSSSATTNTDTTSFVTAADGGEIYNNPHNVQALYDLIAGKENATLDDLQDMIDEVTGGDRERLVPSSVFRAKEYGKTNAQDIQVVFGGQKWQVMALSNSREAENPNIVLTLWLADVLKDNTNAYVQKTFNSGWGISNDNNYSADNIYPNNMYGASYIRAYLNNGGNYLASGRATSLTGVYAADPNYQLKEFLAGGQYNGCLLTPSSLKWQETETSITALTGYDHIMPNDAYGTPRGGNSGWKTYAMSNYVKTSNQDVYNSWQNDYLWLPSLTETGGYSYDHRGMWSTSQNQRASMSGANYQYVWLRSGPSSNSNYVFTIKESGDSLNTYNVQYPRFVRPALHLNLNSAALAALEDNHPLNYQKISQIEPTCADTGLITYKCTGCDASYTEIIPATGEHTYNDGVVTTAPTCVDAGEMTYMCTVCNDSYTEDIPATGIHTYGDWITVTAPKCLEIGRKKQVCSVCNHEDFADINAYGSHDYQQTDKTEPTCTTEGFTTYTCSRCGDHYDADTVAKTGHSLGEWFEDVPPTCTDTGTEKRECQNDGCDYYETRTKDALGHNYQKTSTTQPTCTTEGFSTYTCSNCGDHYDADTVAKKDHVFNDEDWVEIAHPDCSNSGAEECKCANCDYVTTRDLATNAEHDLPSEWTVTIDPTCVTKGLQKKQCSRCDYFESEEINALGHDYQPDVTAPTCTSTGYTTYKCSRCDDSYFDDETEMLPHSYGEWTVVTPATCLTKGLKKQVCSVCEYEDFADIDALGHDHQPHVTKPTCTSTGYTKYECSRCGDSYIDEDSETPMLAHSYGEWEITSEASCLQTGEQKRVCAGCGCCETQTIDALGHDDQKEVVAPTCTTVGYIKHTCARCKDTYNSDETVKAAHTYGEWTQTLAPTVDEPGLEQRTCTVCGDIQGREIAKLEPTPEPENEFPVVPVVAGSAAAVTLIGGIAVTTAVLVKRRH